MSRRYHNADAIFHNTGTLARARAERLQIPEYLERTGEFRAPKKGEYYLSGSIPMAYLAPNDLTQIYHILRPCASPPRRIVIDGFAYQLIGPAEEQQP
jgi:hypothetical protein